MNKDSRSTFAGVLSSRSFFTNFSRRASRRVGTLVIGALFQLILLSAADAAILTTDKSDYTLGSTAIISGQGFASGEPVQLQVVHAGGINDTNADHNPWTVSADTNGSFTTSWCVCEMDDLDSTLIVTATGMNSGFSATATFTDGGALQGQNKGDTTNWFSVNLLGWFELDYIPFRVLFSSGSTGSQTVTLDFPHLSGTIPGFEDLTSFTAFTTNVVFTSGPTLTTDPSGTWHYAFTVNITDTNVAEVRFFARLAAGAHLNGGSSLHLNSSVGNVQIHKPGNVPGSPDLAIVKHAPAFAPVGGTISYSLTYTNQSTNTALGTQISDILPPELTVDTNTLPANGHLVGNTIFWDLNNVPAHSGGRILFQAQISPSTPGGSVITNFSQILSSQDDLNPADNSSAAYTTVTNVCVGVSLVADPLSATACAGDTVLFSVAVNGSSPFGYQWRKGGTNISGATGSSFSVASASSSDAASYDVVVTNQCGTATSGAATLALNSLTTADALVNQTNCPGGTVTFSTTAHGTGPFTYQWLKDTGLLTDQTNSSLVVSNLTGASAGIYSVQVSGACNTVTNFATLLVQTNPPSITCPTNFSVQCFGDVPAAATNLATFLAAGGSASDDSGSVSVAFGGDVAATNGCIITITRTYLASDPCGNSNNCSQTITVQDTTPPSINCATNKIVECGTAWSFDQPVAFDNCSGTNVAIYIIGTTTNALCGNTFSATRTWAAVDACSNTNVCSQTVTVMDTTLPSIICATNKTVECGTAWTFDAPSAPADACGTNTIIILGTTTNALCGNTFSATRTWAAIDACNNTNTCSQTVTVVDTTLPSITCATNKSVECGTAWTFDPPSAPADACGTNSIVILSTTTNALCGNTFSATRTWAAIDACNNTNTCSQTVTVVDTTLPSIICATNRTVECGTAWTFDPPSATADGCGTNRIVILTTTTNALCGNTFSATRTWAAIDACNNTNTCSQTVMVVDTTLPSIVCATNKTVECGTAWTFDQPSAPADGCGTNRIVILATVTNSLCGNTFSATRTWAAIDACNNTNTCSQTVTVVDTTLPNIICATNKIVECGAAWTFDPPSAPADACGTNSIVILSTTTNALCGNTFSATRTWAAIDACNNTNTCSQTVTVVDTTRPSITCATNKSVECGTAWTFDPPSAPADACGTNRIVILTTTTNALCGNTFSATRTWAAIDACNNTNTCSQTVTVVDTTLPSITCATNKTVECGTAWTFDPPSAPVDACGTNRIVILSTATNALCGNTFSATRTWAAIDACNNTNTCSQTVTVVDTTLPSITCATNKTVECGTAWTFDPLSAPADACGTNRIVILSTTTNALCGNTFSATRTWAAIDACNNTNTCSQTVTVVDTTLPSITCATNKTVECGTAWTFDPPSAPADACGTNRIVILSTTTNALCGNTFSATRTWAAIDACNNTNSCSQTVTVVDTTRPGITCATNKTVECGTAWTFDPPSAPADACGTNRIVILTTTTNALCGNTFSATRIWAAIDACNNTNTCSQTVTVVDTMLPSITCATNKTVECGTAWTFDPPSAPADACGTNRIVILTTTTNALCGNTFSATRTWAAIDACNNTNTCSQTVTVVDTTLPSITCATNRTVALGVTWTFDLPGAPADGCGTNRIVILNTLTNPLCGNSFMATRTWAAIDPCNNSNTCSQTVTVLDTNLPSIDVVSHCNPQAIEAGQSVSFTGFVTNSGSSTLTNITITDPLLNTVIVPVSILVPGGSAPFSATYPNNDSVCASRVITNTVIAAATNICDLSQGATATNNCTFSIVCPNICVIKQIACFLGTNNQGAEICDNFGRLATGIQGDTQNPAFCYRITVTNCGQVDLTNVTVIDDKYGDLTTNFFSSTSPVLPVGVAVSYTFKVDLGGASMPHQTALITNTALVGAQSVLTGRSVSAADYAVAQIIPAGLSLAQSYSVDGSPLTNCIRLSDSSPHLLVIYVTVTNPGLCDMMNVSLTNDIADPCAVNAGPFMVPAGGTLTVPVCTNSAYVCDNTIPMIMAAASVYANTNLGTICSSDINGAVILVRNEAIGCVQCTLPNACRITGGGRQDSPLVYPPDVRYVTHGGQVGAPVGDANCVVNANLVGNPCIHGRWTHVRHAQGGLKGNFQARFFDTLDSACLDTNVGAGGYYGPGTLVNGICYPDNNSAGPGHPQASANKIAFSGIGDWSDGGQREPNIVLFRVDVEDRGGHGNGGKPPPDRYRIRIWVLTDVEQAELHGGGPDPFLHAFRNAISACNGVSVRDGADVPNGTAAFGVRPPEIDDGGELQRGKAQIHPSVMKCN